MRHAVKNILLSLSFLLAFAGIQKGVALEVQSTGVHAPAVQDTATYADYGKLYTKPGPIQDEQLRIWQPRPSPPFNEPSTIIPELAWVQEVRLQLKVRQYLQRAVDFCPGLRGCDIIFPFHYFW